MTAKRGVQVGVVLASLMGASGHTQTPPRLAAPPTIAVGVEVVQLHVSVTDPKNQFVAGLAQDDFSIFEDGLRQDVSLFAREQVPISLTLLVDGSASMHPNLDAVRAAAGHFISVLTPRDTGALLLFNDHLTTLQPFTSDRARLAAALTHLEADGSTALHNAIYVALRSLAKERARGELCRRAIVLLTDGEDTASVVPDEDVLELARQTEIAIYAIRLFARPKVEQDERYDKAIYLLTRLAQESGGEVYLPATLSELDSVYQRIAEELRMQYTLGYVSSNGRRDRGWRRIIVQIAKKDRLRIRHKIGYYAKNG